LKGDVVATFLRGEKIYERGSFSETPSGQMLLRESKPSRDWDEDDWDD
jgi:hypothetical protein